MAMVNMNNLLNMKDSRWLQLEVCREFQRNKCSRPDTECKFAHPPVNVEVQNGRVTACYDSLKGRCNREKPPCKYFHPPLHLKDQLLINGRNHLALKNALMQQMGMGPGQGVVPGQVPAVATNPYLGVTNSYNPYFPTGPLVSLVSDPSGAQVMSPLGVPQQAVIQQKNHSSYGYGYAPWERECFRRYQPQPWYIPATPPWHGTIHRNHSFKQRSSPHGNPEAPVSPDSTSRSKGYPTPPQPTSYPGMVTYKRPAEKGGVPVYPQANSASAAAYQHLMQLQQPFVPVSSSSIQQQLQHHHQQLHQTATTTSPVHATTSTSPETNGPQADSTDLLDGPVLKKLKAETDDGGSHGDESANGVGTGNGEGPDEESKDEGSGSSIVKRLRVNAGGTPPQATLSNNSTSGSGGATAVMVQNNNAAYAAAAQNYHSAIAAMTYTGASLQANKGVQGVQSAAHNSIQSQLQYPAALQQQQQQQSQQQQLIQQYQAMAAAAFASQAGFQTQGGNASANQLTGQQLSSGLPFAMNPYLAALPQLAAAQRAQLLQQQQAAGVAGAFGQVQGLAGAGGAFPFGLQLGAATGLTAANIQQFQQSQQQQQQQQQQAILAAAYGQFARAPVPVVSAAPSLTQQLYIGSPVGQGTNGPLQGAVGVKRMRPG